MALWFLHCSLFFLVYTLSSTLLESFLLTWFSLTFCSLWVSQNKRTINIYCYQLCCYNFQVRNKLVFVYLKVLSVLSLYVFCYVFLLKPVKRLVSAMHTLQTFLCPAVGVRPIETRVIIFPDDGDCGWLFQIIELFNGRLSGDVWYIFPDYSIFMIDRPEDRVIVNRNY